MRKPADFHLVGSLTREPGQSAKARKADDGTDGNDCSWEGAAATPFPLPDFLAAFLTTANDLPSCARYQVPWEGAEARLRVAHERLEERAKEGQHLSRSFGISRLRPKTPLISCHCGGDTAEAMRLKQRLTFARKGWGDRSMM